MRVKQDLNPNYEVKYRRMSEADKGSKQVHSTKVWAESEEEAIDKAGRVQGRLIIGATSLTKPAAPETSFKPPVFEIKSSAPPPIPPPTPIATAVVIEPPTPEPVSPEPIPVPDLEKEPETSVALFDEQYIYQGHDDAAEEMDQQDPPPPAAIKVAEHHVGPLWIPYSIIGGSIIGTWLVIDLLTHDRVFSTLVSCLSAVLSVHIVLPHYRHIHVWVHPEAEVDKSASKQ